MIHFNCSACGKGIRVNGSGAGKDGRCPACGAVAHVPDIPPVTATATPPPLNCSTRSVVAADDKQPPELSEEPHAGSRISPRQITSVLTSGAVALARLCRFDLKARIVLAVIAATLGLLLLAFLVRPSNQSVDKLYREAMVDVNRLHENAMAEAKTVYDNAQVVMRLSSHSGKERFLSFLDDYYAMRTGLMS